MNNVLAINLKTYDYIIALSDWFELHKLTEECKQSKNSQGWIMLYLEITLYTIMFILYYSYAYTIARVLTGLLFFCQSQKGNSAHVLRSFFSVYLCIFYTYTNIHDKNTTWAAYEYEIWIV